MNEQSMDKSALAMKTFVFGAMLGGLAAVLFAPKSGRETREQIKNKAEEVKQKAAYRRDELVDKVHQQKQQAKAKLSEKLDETKDKADKGIDKL